MAVESTSGKSFSIGSVFSNAFSVVGRNFISFAVIAALSEAPSLAFSWLTKGQNLVIRTELLKLGYISLTSYAGTLIAGLLISLTFTYVLQAALIYGTVSDLNGRRASFGACLATGLRSFLPLAALAILAGLGIGLGLILLVVPGVILWVGWSVAIPIRVVEGKPIFDVFRRSWELTEGHRWAIFGLLIIFVLSAVALQALLFPLANLTRGISEQGPLYIAATAILRVVVAMFGATLVGVLYYELRSVKEGIGPEALAAVFD